jgi:hypothetical protein
MIFSNMRSAVVGYATGRPISRDEAATLHLGIMPDGVPRILLGEYRDLLRSKDKRGIQEILSLLDLRLLTPEYKDPNLESITGFNPSNLMISELVRTDFSSSSTGDPEVNNDTIAPVTFPTPK